MTDRTDEFDLEEFFAAARGAAAPVPESLLARVVLDAATAHPVAGPAPRDRFGWFRQIGGWPALGGMVAASVAGLWLGVVQPSSVSGLTSSVFGTEVSVSVFADDAILTTES